MNLHVIYKTNKTVMKKLFLMILALGLASSLPAQTLPDVGIENQSGETVSTKSLIGGKPMIISFWSTTCKPLYHGVERLQTNSSKSGSKRPISRWSPYLPTIVVR